MPVSGGAHVDVLAFITVGDFQITSAFLSVIEGLVLLLDSLKPLNPFLFLFFNKMTENFIAAVVGSFGSIEGNYQVVTQGRGIIHISQVSLSLLDGLHAAVDGPHQGLLGQTLLMAT